MGGISPGELGDLLEQFGVPGVLVLVSIWFLISHLRTDRGPPPEPHWAADIRRIMQDLKSARESDREKLDDIGSKVQEILTTIRIASGRRGGD